MLSPLTSLTSLSENSEGALSPLPATGRASTTKYSSGPTASEAWIARASAAAASASASNTQSRISTTEPSFTRCSANPSYATPYSGSRSMKLRCVSSSSRGTSRFSSK
jgi:hypothetical protein